MATYRILSCDGGGIRGYMTARMIQQLDQQYGILQHVDLFAGTSTGGIIALALAAGVPISTVVNIYGGPDAKTIFTPLGFQTSCYIPLPGVAGPAAVGANMVEELFQSKYNNVGAHSLQSVLKRNLPAAYTTLTQLPRSALVTSFQLLNATSKTWQPLTFDNLPGSLTAPYGVLDAALCTSAAPTYFPPYNHPVLGYCADGGVFANNPALLAVTRAIQSGQAADDIVLLSLGTGITASSMAVSSAVCCGIMKWFWPEASGATPPFALLDILMDGTSMATDAQCVQMLDAKNYLRANPPLTQPIALDDYKQVPLMAKIVNAYMQSPAWTGTIAPWVQANF